MGGYDKFQGGGVVDINLAVEDESGRLQPIEAGPELHVIPRIGETICFGNRRVSAEVRRVEYLLPMAGGELIVAVILDRAPAL